MWSCATNIPRTKKIKSAQAASLCQDLLGNLSSKYKYPRTTPHWNRAKGRRANLPGTVELFDQIVVESHIRANCRRARDSRKSREGRCYHSNSTRVRRVANSS